MLDANLSQCLFSTVHDVTASLPVCLEEHQQKFIWVWNGAWH